ncbi:unnamed protein product [Urochloa humidicola]
MAMGGQPIVLTASLAPGSPRSGNISVRERHPGACLLYMAPSGSLPPAAPLRNTAMLLLLWIIWKSCNRMIFDAVDQDMAAIATELTDHARLERHDGSTVLHSILAWCSTLPV